MTIQQIIIDSIVFLISLAVVIFSMHLFLNGPHRNLMPYVKLYVGHSNTIWIIQSFGWVAGLLYIKDSLTRKIRFPKGEHSLRNVDWQKNHIYMESQMLPPPMAGKSKNVISSETIH